MKAHIHLFIVFLFFSSLRSNEQYNTDLGIHIDRSILHADQNIENGERRIVVVIGSYNNKQWYKKNLDSIFNQNYQNYRIIYVDDCSKDGTGDLVEQYIKEQGQEHRVLLIKNTKRRFKMANTYRAYHLCNDSDIIIELDGDDWVLGDDVFTRYNEIYADPNVWMAYGHYEKWPSLEPQYMNEISQDIIKTNSFRKFQGRCWEGLRSYYAWLVKQIKVEDFLYQGRFMARTSDVAIMFPMFEMSGSRFKLLTKIMMQHNNASNLNDYKVDGRLQYATYLNLMKRLAYKRLDAARIDYLDTFKNEKVDLIFYSNNNPAAAHEFLQSIDNNMPGIDTISIIYEASDSAIDELYGTLKNHHPRIICIKKNTANAYLSSIVQRAIELENNYVIFANDSSRVIQPIDLPYCIQRLEQTKADAFFFTLSLGSPQVSINNFIEDDVYLSQFYYMDESLKKFTHRHMALYRTSELKKLARSIEFNFNKYAEKKLTTKKIGGNKTALFFEHAPASQCL